MSSCGFFRHPNDPNYGATPDGFTEAFVVEVKTRPENAETPLEKSLAHMSFREISKSVVQRDRSYSYSDTYQKEKSLIIRDFSFWYYCFFIKRNDLLIDVMKEIADHILKHEVVTEWHYEENSYLAKLGKQLLGSIPTFDILRIFGSWVNSMAKQVKKVVFN